MCFCKYYSCTAPPKHLFKAQKVVEGYANKNIKNVVCLPFAVENVASTKQKWWQVSASAGNCKLVLSLHSVITDEVHLLR